MAGALKIALADTGAAVTVYDFDLELIRRTREKDWFRRCPLADIAVSLR
jgi:hypothetical protein